MSAAVGRVGVVGLGRMGGPLAGHLAAAGFAVLGVDPGPGTLPRETPVHRVVDVDDLADCDVVVVTVAGRVVPDVLLRDGELRPALRGPDLLVCSTVAPEQMAELHEAVARGGGRALDAPLCRGDHGAREGRLLALVGGDAALLRRTEPVLRAFCSDVVLVGGPGAGQTAKLVNNLLLWVHMAAAVEGLRLAEELGVPRGPLVEGLRLSSADSWVLETWARPRDLPWADEDLRMVLEEAGRVGLAVPLAGAVERVIGGVRASGVLAEGGFGARGWRLPAYPDEEGRPG